jgi:hypothetical protein
MKKLLSSFTIGLFLVSGIFLACSSKKEAEPKKGAIDQFTDQAAKDLSDHLRAPINKARSAAKQAEDRMKEIDKKD